MLIFSFANSMSTLVELFLQNNMLSGTVPAALSELPNLELFYIAGNKLTGTIPDDICKMELNKSFFKDWDQKNGKPDYCNSVSCPVGSFSFEDIFPCKSCGVLLKNPYLGLIDPKSNCHELTQSYVLEQLRMEWNIASWNNALKEKINKNGNFVDSDWCSLEGITCNKSFEVVGIKLRGMDITGSIPNQIGFLETLATLDLSNNKITGFVPSDLRFAPLDSLDLGGNKLIGIVPPLLCLKSGINGNGKDNRDCAHIACPVGSYSSTGWGTGTSKCSLCEFMGIHLGSTSCTNYDATILATSGVKTVGEYFRDTLAVLFITSVLLGFLFLLAQHLRVAVLRRSSCDDDGIIHPTEMEIHNVSDDTKALRLSVDPKLGGIGVNYAPIVRHEAELC